MKKYNEHAYDFRNENALQLGVTRKITPEVGPFLAVCFRWLFPNSFRNDYRIPFRGEILDLELRHGSTTSI